MASDFSKAADAMQLLSTMSRLELVYLKEKITKQLKTMPLIECFLLKLPRELRDHIYFFVAIASITDPKNKSEMPVSGLSAACKQTRVEFDDTIYSSKIIQIDYYDSGTSEWKIIDEPKAIRTFLNSKKKSISFRSTSYESRAALQHQVERDSKWGGIGFEGVLGLVTADEAGGLIRFRVPEKDLRSILAAEELVEELEVT